MADKDRILVLGSASWLGSLFLDKISAQKFEITATYFNTYLKFQEPVNLVESKLIKDYSVFLEEIQPKIIVNFLRSDNSKELAIHEHIVHYCKNNKDCHYLFSSSVLALDGHKEVPLTEDLLASSTSEYGIFKEKCERLLYDVSFNWSILRFSSLQGFCRHKIIRNEMFLRQLHSGENIRVDQKVFQNRLFANDAVEIIFRIIKYKLTGIIHIGATDCSDEIDFLRKQAALFGYDQGRVMSKNYVRNANLNCIPHKIFKIYNDSKFFNEADTLSKVSKINAYQKLRFSNGH